MSKLLGNATDIKSAIEKAINENAGLKAQVEDFFAERVENITKEVISKASIDKGILVMTLEGPRIPDVVKSVAFAIRKKMSDEHFIFIGATRDGDKPLLTVMISDNLVKQGLNAGQAVRQAAKLIKGGGGGQPFFAQAGGKSVEGLSAAKQEILKLLLG